jgi:hypothetical protein
MDADNARTHARHAVAVIHLHPWATGRIGLSGAFGHRSARVWEGRLAMRLEPSDKIRTLRRKLYVKAKTEPDYRFNPLHDRLWRGHILAHADAVANANDGAPGVDGESFARIEANGRQSRLDRLREGVRTKRCRPEAVRRMMLKRGMMREPDATARIIEAYWYDRVRDCLAGRGIRHVREDAGFGALGVPRRRLRRNTSATCA